MFGILVLCAALWLLFIRFVLYPVVWYFIDPKGLRRYPNMSLLSGMTDLPFMFEAARGFRSKHLARLHKTHPVIRIGPNSLSYGDARAIKVRIHIDFTACKLTLSRIYTAISRSAPKTICTICSPEHIFTSPMS